MTHGTTTTTELSWSIDVVCKWRCSCLLHMCSAYVCLYYFGMLVAAEDSPHLMPSKAAGARRGDFVTVIFFPSVYSLGVGKLNRLSLLERLRVRSRYGHGGPRSCVQHTCAAAGLPGCGGKPSG
jgi:hypothetical protein